MSTIKIRFDRNSAESVRKAYVAAKIIAGDVSMIDNEVSQQNSEQWEIDLQTSVQQIPEWDEDMWVTRGSKVSHEGVVYNVIQSHLTSNQNNTSVLSLYRRSPVIYPGQTYPRWDSIGIMDSENNWDSGERVEWNGADWESTVDNNVWEPGAVGVTQWTNLNEEEPEEPEGYPAWVQPAGGHDAYNIGDRVSHNENDWESTATGNVWEPGVFGWNQL